jgi:hypothetical protein
VLYIIHQDKIVMANISNAKVNSQVVSAGQLTVDILRGIDTEMDLGNGLTLTSIVLMLEETRSSIANYNSSAIALETTREQMRTQEKLFQDTLKKTVLAVGAKYGHKSKEYTSIKQIWQLTRRGKTSATPSTSAGSSTSVTSINGSTEMETESGGAIAS